MTGGDGDDVAHAVVAAVADRKGVDETDLDPRLNSVVDPDALNAVFKDGTGRLSFEYHGFRVTVDSGSGVDLEPLDGD